MNIRKKRSKSIKRLVVSIFALVGIFVVSQQSLLAKETGIDLYCFRNASYIVIGEISYIKDSVDAKDYEHLKDKVVEIEIMEVLKGGPLPKNISVLFELDSKHANDERLVKGGKVLLFLDPSSAYYYMPIFYGSVYYIKDADIGEWTKKIENITSILYGAISEEILKEYGFYDFDDCKIFYKMGGGETAYTGEVALSGSGVATIEIKQTGIKEPFLVNLKVPQEYIKDLISTFARADFFNIKYAENKTVKDASWETLAYSYGERSNTMEGYTDTYATDLDEYYFSELSWSLYKLSRYVVENRYHSSDEIYYFKDPSLVDSSFDFVKMKVELGEIKQSYENLINCEEKDKLIPYLISKIDFKNNTFWLQGETRVDVVRLLRYLTRKNFGYDDKFIYNSNDEEIQKVKSAWNNLWENR